MGQLVSSLHQRVLWEVMHSGEIGWKEAEFPRWPLSKQFHRMRCTAYVCLLSGTLLHWNEVSLLTHETRGFLLKSKPIKGESWRVCVQRIVLSATNMNITKDAIIPLGRGQYHRYLSFENVHEYAIFGVVCRQIPELDASWAWRPAPENFYPHRLPQRTTLQLLRYVMMHEPPATLTPLTAWTANDTYHLKVHELNMVEGWRTAETKDEQCKIYVGIIFCKAPSQPFVILQLRENPWINLPWGYVRVDDQSCRTAAIRLIKGLAGIETKASDLLLWRSFREGRPNERIMIYCVLCTGTLPELIDQNLSWRTANDVFEESKAEFDLRTVNPILQELVHELVPRVRL